MKLHDWQITQHLKESDWLAAINIVCEYFSLNRFSAESPAMQSIRIHISGKEYQQIRIALNNTIYVWQPGVFYTRLSPVKGPWITMWVNKDEAP